MDLTGIHHLTAITANARANRNSYRHAGPAAGEENREPDDTSAYHLFYADGWPRPGRT